MNKYKKRLAIKKEFRVQNVTRKIVEENSKPSSDTDRLKQFDSDDVDWPLFVDTDQK